ncbi:Swt1 family HEPN domain-containing protein [Sedimenticola selenatireducens]|uniref:Swt1 family HEPN domain-containing protein n=1 Tax=Sedimenticola selenatireducens TaxID=191960 RepID=UPI00048A838E|nr:Swt1 family HEPN domain-containing protein [Sedimenticola selenatireducens]
MKGAPAEVYDFVFKGLLTEEALDRAGRKNRSSLLLSDEEIANTLSISSLPDDLVNEARQMAMVYTAVAAFENAVRELISGVLLESKGENWWEDSVSQKIRERAEKRRDDELKVKWHTQRGSAPINYTTMADLINIMRNNWDDFEAHIQSIDWAANVFDAVERSRNVIMHSGVLEKGDIERLGIFIRDWVKQVGT